MKGRRAGCTGRRVLAALVVGTGLVVAGCDYWPPALQAQIEQLRQEAQIASTERLKIESQLMDARKDRDQMQSRLDELSRSNQALSGEISRLEQALSAERNKVAQLSKGGPKVVAKTPAPKAAAKATSKKKSAKSAKRRG